VTWARERPRGHGALKGHAAPSRPGPPALLPEPPRGTFKRIRKNSSKRAQSAILHRDPLRFRPSSIACLWAAARPSRANVGRARIRISRQITAMANAVHRDQHRIAGLASLPAKSAASRKIAITSPGSSLPHHIVAADGAVSSARRLRRHAMVDPDAGCLRALGRPMRADDAWHPHDQSADGRSFWRKFGGAAYASLLNPARLKVPTGAGKNERPRQRRLAL